MFDIAAGQTSSEITKRGQAEPTFEIAQFPSVLNPQAKFGLPPARTGVRDPNRFRGVLYRFGLSNFRELRAN